MLEGIDFSKWQNQVDWEDLAANDNLEFVILKATEV